MRDLLIGGFLSGALLGFATSLGIMTTVPTGLPAAGAVTFPVGLVIIIIVLLGLEFLTGNFASLPAALLETRCSAKHVLRNFAAIFAANLAGSVFYGVLLALSFTMMGKRPPDAVASKIIAIAEAKTHYTQIGLPGLTVMTVRTILCNWMVCLGVVVAMTSTSTAGKIIAAWLPILTFFAHGYEHSVVNMFVIPTGMLLGARASMSDGWMGNQSLVTLGDFVGGCLFTGLSLYWTYRPHAIDAPAHDKQRGA